MIEAFFQQKLLASTDMLRTLRKLRLITDKEYSFACMCMYYKTIYKY